MELDLVKGVDLHLFLEVGIALAVFGGGFIFGIAKKWKKYKPSKKQDKKYWKLNGRLHETLTELRVKTDCARAQIVQFHNGEYFMDGVCMRMMSLTHESLQNGIEGEGSKKQRLQLSMFMPLMGIVTADEPTIQVVKEKDESFCKQFMEASNVIAFCTLPIRKQGMVTGYVICQWCSEAKASKLSAKKIASELTHSRDTIEVGIIHQNGI
tara:strand:+ start:492 stop:1121 length:630 start_codon:yes stop_codon:yes gene_type:complete